MASSATPPAAAAPSAAIHRACRLLIPILLCAATLLPLADASAQGAAQDAAPPSDTAAHAAPPARASDAIRYRVEIVAPDELRALIEENVDLVRWQAYDGMTAPLLDRLMREAVEETREAAATLGYFSPAIDVAIDRAQPPFKVTLSVKPGEPARVSDVAIEVAGDASRDPHGREAIARLSDAWLLPRGSAWRQSAWTEAKAHAVATLAAGPWAAAKIARSEARIEPERASAALSVTIDSGPPFRYGGIDVRGLSRYPSSLVENFSTLEPGAPYRASEVDQLARRLAASGYFSSVQAAIDADAGKADQAPVQVALIEGRTRKLEAGVGYSTDTAFRANASYSDVDIDGRALQLYTVARLEQKLQGASVRFVRPPTPTHWRDTLAAAWQRTDIENLVTTTASATARRVSVDEHSQRAYGIGLYIDEQQPSGAETIRSHALYVDAQHTWRRVDDLLSPTRGYVLDVELGGGVPGASTRTFGRAIARVAAFRPLAPQLDLSARLQAGAVLAASRDGIPSTLLFRTGGDTTVRGYAFESIGVGRGDATVGGRYELVGSVEVTRWMAPQWGVAAFVDAGNATDQAGDLTHPKVGYGLGARVRTPIGPFRIDVAYGQDARAVRLHFSVGLSF